MAAPDPHTVNNFVGNNLTVVILTKGQAETVTEMLSSTMARTTFTQGPGALTTTTLANHLDAPRNGNDNGSGGSSSSRGSAAGKNDNV